VPVDYAPRTVHRRRSRAVAAEDSAETGTDAETVPSRSHAPAYVALALVLVGWVLASWSVVVPGLLALALLSAGLAFLGSRLNPLSIGFYLTTKPSWTAIGAVFLSALLLIAITYSYWTSGRGPVLPHHLVP
jgi:hypothetical protein